MLGIMTGLAAEARLVLGATDCAVCCSASNPQRTREQMATLLAAGATHCLSFGIAGGLARDLVAGSVIIADHIASATGRWVCDPAWVTSCAAALPQARVGGLWGGEKIIADPAEKAALHQASDCLACDMESHIVAERAQAAGLPFLALRVVCDPADFALPSAALLPLRADGTPNLPAILGALARHPSQLPALITLGMHNRTAMQSLAQIAAYVRALRQ